MDVAMCRVKFQIYITTEEILYCKTTPTSGNDIQFLEEFNKGFFYFLDFGKQNNGAAKLKTLNHSFSTVAQPTCVTAFGQTGAVSSSSMAPSFITSAKRRHFLLL